MATSSSNAPTLDLARELIARRSQTPDDAGCQDLLGKRLARSGFRCESLVANGVSNLWARRGDAHPIVCFAGHTDVVPSGPLDAWESDPFDPSLRDSYRTAARGGHEVLAGGVRRGDRAFVAHTPTIPARSRC